MIERAKPALDLTRHHFKREMGDITVFGTWLYNADEDESEPCIVLLPTYRILDVKPCVIALSSAFRYNDPRHLARAAAIFAENLGFHDSLTARFKVADLILDHLDQLVKMPVDPVQAIKVGEAVLYDGDTKRTLEVMDYEQTRQA